MFDELFFVGFPEKNMIAIELRETLGVIQEKIKTKNREKSLQRNCKCSAIPLCFS